MELNDLRTGSFDIENFSISYENRNWYEYFKCGIQGIRDKYPDVKLKGMNEEIDEEKEKVMFI